MVLKLKNSLVEATPYRNPIIEVQFAPRRVERLALLDAGLRAWIPLSMLVWRRKHENIPGQEPA